jgi:hypothetical protein
MSVFGECERTLILQQRPSAEPSPLGLRIMHKGQFGSSLIIGHSLLDIGYSEQPLRKKRRISNTQQGISNAQVTAHSTRRVGHGELQRGGQRQFLVRALAILLCAGSIVAED